MEKIIFFLIVLIVCLISLVIMKNFDSKKQNNKSIKKEFKNPYSIQKNGSHNDSGTNTNDAEADWMNAVMTTAFITASMKSAQDHSESNHHDSNLGNHENVNSQD
ncbi:hypothetical protein P4261_28895 [Bacillus thuringiensis]|nr:hypothetical protein [Bacillus thuringiensis]MED2810979.1 hypothetical protein [Bacillus thuringiensis]MED2828935.1 hypothetical protein [Bacillus thuringiensis]MED2852564.1 hypothetical protein [Bacillus thuringiensis]MED2856001.1 hypothetical protein [Bacillus thuringiensis]